MSSDDSMADRLFGGNNLLLLLAAGAAAEVILEMVSWWAFPPLLGMPMRPHILVGDVTRSLAGVDLPTTVAVAGHLALGLFIFPAVYLLARDKFGFQSVLLPGVVFGVLLWLIAQTTLAPLAGRPFMLGFIPYTWGSLVAHIVYTVVLAKALERLFPRGAA